VVCRGAGLRVIQTAHVLRPDGSNAPMGSVSRRRLAYAWFARCNAAQGPDRHGCGHGAREAALRRVHGTDLEIVLRANGIDAVIVGGITTNVCCDTTAREAVACDFRLFSQDGTATNGIGDVSAEQMQTATCATLSLPDLGKSLHWTR
jgi:hypothetical protein